MPAERRFSASLLETQTEQILEAWGMPQAQARLTAQLIVATDLLGIESHGVSMLPQYDTMVRNGKIRLAGTPRLIREAGATSLWDGAAGLGHPVAHAATAHAIGQARQHGIALAGVRNSHHFGAAGLYARQAAREGLVALVTSSSQALMLVPTHASMPVLGTNPIAFAAPAGAAHEAVVLDIATTTSAANKVKVRALRGQQIPTGWAVDGNGQPITDAEQARRQVYELPEGGLTPLGSRPDLSSHKGYGLALLAQILGATLNGAAFSATAGTLRTPDAPADIGHSIIVIDPGFLGGQPAFEHSVAGIIDHLHTTPALDPAQPVLVPGDPEAQAHAERLAHGIPLPDALLAQLAAVTTRANIPFLLDTP